MATGQKYTFKKSATTTVTGNSGWIRVGKSAIALVLRLQANLGTGTTPTLDWTVKTNKVGSDTGMRDVHAPAWTQTTTAANTDQQRRLTDIDEFVKVVWTVAGTTPSFPLVSAVGTIERKFSPS